MSFFNWKKPSLFDPNNPICIWLNILNMTLMSMLVIIDLLSSVVVTEQIQGYMEIDDTRAAWIGKAFFFASALAPLYSIPAANKYGYKMVLFVGHIIFSIGSIGTGFSTNYYELLLFRFLGGMGGGIVLTVSLNIINLTVPEKYRNRAIITYTNLFFGGGIALGLLLGGFYGQEGVWRSVFLINLYFSLPTLILTWILIPETDPSNHKPFDFCGFFCLSSFFFTLLVIVTQAKAPWNTLGWRSPFMESCYFILLISGVACLLHSYRNDFSLIDLKLFIHIRFCIGCAGLIVIGFMVFGVTIELMSLLQNVYQYQYWMVGKFVSIVGVIYCLFGLITAFLSHFINPRIFILIGMVLIVISCLLHQNITIQSTPMQIGGLLALRSLGIAIVLGPFTVLALSPFSKEDACHAVALLTFFRQMAATFGSALIGLIIAMRTPFHSARFGEQVNIESARFKNYFQEFNNHLSVGIGQGRYIGQKQTNELIITWIEQQAEIASLNDAISILGYASIVITLFVVILMTYRLHRKKELLHRK